MFILSGKLCVLIINYALHVYKCIESNRKNINTYIYKVKLLVIYFLFYLYYYVYNIICTSKEILHEKK